MRNCLNLALAQLQHLSLPSLTLCIGPVKLYGDLYGQSVWLHKMFGELTTNQMHTMHQVPLLPLVPPLHYSGGSRNFERSFSFTKTPAQLTVS